MVLWALTYAQKSLIMTVPACVWETARATPHRSSRPLSLLPLRLPLAIDPSRVRHSSTYTIESYDY